MSDELPPGWVTTPLGGVVSKLVDGSHNPPARAGAGLPMLSAKNVTDDGLSFDEARFVDAQEFEREARRTRIAEGDVLLTIVGSIGRSAVVTGGGPPFTLQRSVAVMSPEGLLPRFLSHQFRSPAAQRYFDLNARGTAQKGIYLNTLREMPIVVAPKREQERIVSKIDELFSRIDEGERALEQVLKLVERYRQSMLKAAVTGELTRDWRAARKARGEPVESGDALLARILTARRQAWEQAELVQMKAKGIKPANTKWKTKYKAPNAPDSTSLPELPAGWVWASLEQMIWQSQNGLSKRRGETGQPVKVLRLADISGGQIDGGDPRMIRLTKEEAERYGLLRGDLVCVRVNGSRNLTGRLIPVGSSNEWAYCDHFIRFRPVPELVLSNYLDLCFDVGVTRNAVESSMVTTAGQNTVSQGSLYQVPVPLPPLEEQQALLSRVELRLSQAFDQMRGALASKKASAALRQTILRSAFTGALVSSSLEDEPADDLLRRIAAERTSSNTVVSKHGHKKKSA